MRPPLMRLSTFDNVRILRWRGNVVSRVKHLEQKESRRPYAVWGAGLQLFACQ